MTDGLRFDNLQDLAQLPWFEPSEGGRVRLRKLSGVGPSIDLHTHLAMAFVRPMQLDLQKRHEWTQHYLPAEGHLDLEVYANGNFTPAQLAEMKRDLELRCLGATGMRTTHTVPNLLAEMEELRIERSVSLPIDLPYLSRNSETTLQAVQGKEQLIAFCGVHAGEKDAKSRLAGLLHAGARGLKVHPAAQLLRPDARIAQRLYRECGDANVPVLWHCGPVGIEPALGQYLSQVRHYEKPIAENPATTFVLGHAGARQPEEALRLLRKYPNVVLELSSQGLPWVQWMVKHADTTRLVFGSDWPFYPQALALAKVLIATEGEPETRHRVLYSNAARVLGLPTA